MPSRNNRRDRQRKSTTAIQGTPKLTRQKSANELVDNTTRRTYSQRRILDDLLNSLDQSPEKSIEFSSEFQRTNSCLNAITIVCELVTDTVHFVSQLLSLAQDYFAADVAVDLAVLLSLRSPDKSDEKLKGYFLYSVKQCLSVPRIELLFREETIYTKFLSRTLFIEGWYFLINVVKPVLKSILKKNVSFELNSDKERNKIQRKLNQHDLINAVLHFLQVIVSQDKKIPNSFRRVMYLIQEETLAKYHISATYQAIGSVFFLRFLTPVIVAPEQVGLRNISTVNRRNLICLSKVIQSVINQGVDPNIRAPEADCQKDTIYDSETQCVVDEILRNKFVRQRLSFFYGQITSPCPTLKNRKNFVASSSNSKEVIQESAMHVIEFCCNQADPLRPLIASKAASITCDLRESTGKKKRTTLSIADAFDRMVNEIMTSPTSPHKLSSSQL